MAAMYWAAFRTSSQATSRPRKYRLVFEVKADEIATRVLCVLNGQFSTDAGKTSLSAPIGIATHPSDGQSASEIFETAVTAAEQARAEGAAPAGCIAATRREHAIRQPRASNCLTNSGTRSSETNSSSITSRS